MIVVSGNTYSTLSFWWFHVVLQTSEFQALNDSTTFNRRSVWIQEILRNGECLANNYDPARDLANGAAWHKLHCLAKVNWARRICFGSSRDDWKIKSLRVRLNIDEPQARIGSTRLFLWFWGQGIPFRDTQCLASFPSFHPIHCRQPRQQVSSSTVTVHTSEYRTIFDTILRELAVRVLTPTLQGWHCHSCRDIRYRTHSPDPNFRILPLYSFDLLCKDTLLTSALQRLSPPRKHPHK